MNKEFEAINNFLKENEQKPNYHKLTKEYDEILKKIDNCQNKINKYKDILDNPHEYMKSDENKSTFSENMKDIEKIIEFIENDENLEIDEIVEYYIKLTNMTNLCKEYIKKSTIDINYVK